MPTPETRARDIFKAHGGMLRTAEARAAGIHLSTLYAMRDAGALDAVARGVYRLSELEPLAHPDLAAVAKRVPQGVLCLVSALAFHELTTQIPHAVHLALPVGAHTPRMDFPPLSTHRFSAASFAAGVETHAQDGVELRVYDAEKTLVDCFKYRNKIGLDVVLEALRNYRRRAKPKFQKILDYAKVCRVENVMRPYLETLA